MGKRKTRALKGSPSKRLRGQHQPGDFVLYQSIWPVRIKHINAGVYIVYSKCDDALYSTTEVHSIPPKSSDWKKLAQKMLKKKPVSYKLWLEDVKWAESGEQDSSEYNPTESPIESPVLPPTESPVLHPTESPVLHPTQLPAESPVFHPTESPVESPVFHPKESPSESPVFHPTESPVESPVFHPTESPVESPIFHPTELPSESPVLHPTESPSESPVFHPTESPVESPIFHPTELPSESPVFHPTESPSESPVFHPTESPVEPPVFHPTESPVEPPVFHPTESPSESPVLHPTESPSESPVLHPTVSPSESPVLHPTESPVESPSESPVLHPTESPSESPVLHPTVSPSESPVLHPTESPVESPIFHPTESPSEPPVLHPTESPVESPIFHPTESPVESPVESPIFHPTESPSESPVLHPTESPVESPVLHPTESPVESPVESPIFHPTESPSESPVLHPTESPVESPVFHPTESPSESPVLRPTESPVESPVFHPTESPSESPFLHPTESPVESPVLHPTESPSESPVYHPTDTGDNDSGFKCHLERVDENLIERDPNHRGIFIRKQMRADLTQTGIRKKSNRVYNNYHCCFVCRKHTTNILKHLRTHKDNEETRELVELKQDIDAGNSKDEDIIKKTQDLTSKQVILRCRGDHQHNIDIKKHNCGELIIARKQEGQFNSESYGPCPLCFEWIKIESFSSKHQKNCTKRKDLLTSKPANKLTKGEAITQSAVLVGLVSEKASKGLVKEVYPIMTRDELTAKAKSDPLIVGLGNNWLQRNLANKLKRKYYTSSRMRGAARLLSHLQDLSGEKLTMMDYIKPQFFDTICEAALLCANVDSDDVEDLASPSAALKIGFDVGRLAQLKLGIGIRQGNISMKEEAEEFNSLMRMEWTLKVSKLAHNRLNQMKLMKSAPLPVPEDLSSISKYIKKELETLDFTSQTSDVYRRAVILTQTRLLTYNKRRSGELEALSMENYGNRSVGLDEADRALLGSELTDLEKHLIDSQQLIMIRGKNSKPVPILVPEDAVRALEYITTQTVRESACVKPWNNFVFANTGESVFRAYDSLKTVCGELSLSAPERITSVTMRKYIATLSQVIDMKEHELEWLCNHLGHTADIHKLHYRATSGFIERVNIGKLMLLQDLNVAGQYAGKRLQDIDIADVIKVNPTPSPRVDEPQNTGVLDEDVFENESTKPKKNSCSTRKKWSGEEEKELKVLFAEQIRMKKNPGLKECMKAIAQSRKQKGLIHHRSWETIKKKVMRLLD